jgi:hypothetical protein
MGGKNERAKTESEVQEEEPKTTKSVFRSEPKGKPIYFSCAERPRDLKKSEITLHNVKDYESLRSLQRMMASVMDRSTRLH